MFIKNLKYYYQECHAEGISYYTTHSGDWEYKLVLGVKNNLLCAGELVKFQNHTDFNSFLISTDTCNDCN